MSQKLESAIAVIGIYIGKNSFHVVGHDERGAIVLRQKWSLGQVETRFANMPRCLIGHIVNAGINYRFGFSLCAKNYRHLSEAAASCDALSSTRRDAGTSFEPIIRYAVIVSYASRNAFRPTSTNCIPIDATMSPMKRVTVACVPGLTQAQAEPRGSTRQMLLLHQRQRR